jgi:K+ transporter
VDDPLLFPFENFYDVFHAFFISITDIFLLVTFIIFKIIIATFVVVDMLHLHVVNINSIIIDIRFFIMNIVRCVDVDICIIIISLSLTSLSLLRRNSDISNTLLPTLNNARHGLCVFLSVVGVTMDDDYEVTMIVDAVDNESFNIIKYLTTFGYQLN